MILSHQKKFIFIHNYKVAGSSIKNSLWKYNNLQGSSLRTQLRDILRQSPKIYSDQFDNHIKAKELRELLPESIFNSYFKFGFVRNPWDWQVSLYTFMLKDKEHHQHDLIKSFSGFDQYIDWRVHNDLHLQKDFFFQKEKCLVDFIGKIETLDRDFDYICSKLNISAQLSHVNRSRKRNDHYLKFYNENTLKLISQAFSEDINLFGYSYKIEKLKKSQLDNQMRS